MEIGLFQLENLILSRTQFTLLNLRTDGALPPELADMLRSAVHVRSADVQAYLTEKKISLDYPVILMCEDGRASGAVAERLGQLGYKNVYVVEGGTEGLLREF
jgi:rhodanese-related sulfurtransferase